MSNFEALCANEPELAKLRTSVREFLAADRETFGWQRAVDSWLSCWDEGFSARLGDAGFLGLTIPPEYGGHGLGHLHRYVVTEELLAQGAPVAAHWIADRQVAPGLLSYGNEEQRQRLRFRPRCRPGPSCSGRGRLGPHRHEGVDQRCTPRPPGCRTGPNQPTRSRASACRIQPVPGAVSRPRHHDQPDRADVG